MRQVRANCGDVKLTPGQVVYQFGFAPLDSQKPLPKSSARCLAQSMETGAMPDGFLRSWIATHVRPVPPSARGEHVKTWAANCVADAMLIGIPYDELQRAAGGDIVSHIKRAADLVAGLDNS
jgi:hypothetical protein